MYAARSDNRDAIIEGTISEWPSRPRLGRTAEAAVPQSARSCLPYADSRRRRALAGMRDSLPNTTAEVTIFFPVSA